MDLIVFFAVGVNDLDMIPSYNRSPDEIRNLGRGGFTGMQQDLYKFKVPQLYNLRGNPFFFHGSSKTSIEDVVDYFDQAIPENARVPESQISLHFRPLFLTDTEKEDLVVFLRDGLEDENLNRYVPESVKSGNCFPNNDVESKIDMGCN